MKAWRVKKPDKEPASFDKLVDQVKKENQKENKKENLRIGKKDLLRRHLKPSSKEEGKKFHTSKRDTGKLKGK